MEAPSPPQLRPGVTCLWQCAESQELGCFKQGLPNSAGSLQLTQLRKSVNWREICAYGVKRKREHHEDLFSWQIFQLAKSCSCLSANSVQRLLFTFWSFILVVAVVNEASDILGNTFTFIFTPTHTTFQFFPIFTVCFYILLLLLLFLLLSLVWQQKRWCWVVPKVGFQAPVESKPTWTVSVRHCSLLQLQVKDKFADGLSQLKKYSSCHPGPHSIRCQVNCAPRTVSSCARGKAISKGIRDSFLENSHIFRQTDEK